MKNNEKILIKKDFFGEGDLVIGDTVSEHLKSGQFLPRNSRIF